MGFWISWGGWNFKAGAPWQAVTAAWHVGEPSGAVFLLGCSNFLTGQHLDNSYSGCALWAWIDMDSMAHDGTWQESACAKTIKNHQKAGVLKKWPPPGGGWKLVGNAWESPRNSLSVPSWAREWTLRKTHGSPFLKRNARCYYWRVRQRTQFCTQVRDRTGMFFQTPSA